MERTRCETCDEMFLPWRRGSRYCSSKCYGESIKRVRREGVGHRTKTAKGHPIAPACGIVAVARLNLYEKIGGGEHACHWCGITLDWHADRYSPNKLLADHLDHDPANDEPENLAPSCNLCNAHRRKNGKSEPIKEDDLTVMWSGVKTRAIERYCNACGGRFLIPPSAAKGNKGRYCSRSCARTQPRHHQ